MPKLISLLIIAAVAAWAFWPADTADVAVKPEDAAEQRSRRDRRDAKHVLRVVPGVYMPGTRPLGTSRPLDGMAEVARRFEQLYPDTRIEFLSVPASQREWLVTQLSSGQAPDILQVNVEDVWQDIQKGWYVPLDPWLNQPNPFVPEGEPGSERWWDQFKYQTITRGKIAPDGRMYCIPLDMIETGIFYNKTAFRELGLSAPQTWQEFLGVQARLEQAGYTPLAVDPMMLADWGVDVLFDQLYFDLLGLINLRQDTSSEYLANYLDWEEVILLASKGFFSEEDPRYVELWRLIKQWRQYMPSSLSATAGGLNVTKLFLTGEAAMIWSASPLVNELALDPNLDFEWGIFYLPRITPETSPLVTGERPMCVIGGAAMQYSLTNSSYNDTGDPETSEKLARAVQFLQLLCVPENTDRVVNELLCFLPNIRGVAPRAQLQPFDDILRRPYTIIKWSYTFDLRFSEVQKRQLELYLNSDVTPEEMARQMGEWIRASSETAVRRKGLNRERLGPAWEAALQGAASAPPAGLPESVAERIPPSTGQQQQ